jgi:hypothetical protein
MDPYVVFPEIKPASETLHFKKLTAMDKVQELKTDRNIASERFRNNCQLLKN